jgi:putative membrane protein
MYFILKWLISALAIMITGYLLPGVVVASFWTAFWLAAFLAIINITLKPLLVIFTLPINILSLGLFIFVINALLIILASSVIKGFEIDGFLTALLFSIVLSMVSYILNVLFDLK